MNSITKIVIAFTGGALIGSAASFIVTKKILEKKYDLELSEARNRYTERLREHIENSNETTVKETESQIENKDSIEKSSEATDLKKIISDNNYDTTDEDTDEVLYPNDPEVVPENDTEFITAETYGEIEGYEVSSYTYHLNGLYSDETHKEVLLEDEKDIFGDLNWRKKIDDSVDGCVYIRNNSLHMDFEIVFEDTTHY